MSVLFSQFHEALNLFFCFNFFSPNNIDFFSTFHLQEIVLSRKV